MISVKLQGTLNTTEKWCSKNISKRTYWLHNRIGGPGWEIRGTTSSIWNSNTVLIVENELDALAYKLCVK